ncbi:MAG: hypothetical protein IJ519_01815 [Clostridia bacterium]|nr:hypothetical protein [Clostridia bacterium]
MGHSILYTPDTALGAVGKEALYHLSVDKLLEEAGVNTQDRGYTLTVLTKPPIDTTTVIYRQNTVKDFERHPVLLEQLSDFYERFSALSHDHEAIRKEAMRTKISGGMGHGAAKNILQSNAVTLKRALLFIKELASLFDGVALSSDALKGLSLRAKEIAASQTTEELLTMCGRYEYTLTGKLDYRLALNDFGKIESVVLVGEKSARQTKQDTRRWPFSKKNTEPEMPCSAIHVTESRLFDDLVSEPIAAFSSAFDSVSRQIFAEFMPVGKELAFYRACAAMVKLAKRTGAPLCYPSVKENCVTECEELYDMLLLAILKSKDKVTPNSISLSENGRGTVLFGNNGSGKTVFLRSVGTLRLFAQSGLPVCAEKASVSLAEQIITHFSQSEKDFAKGNDAGRFEQECSRIAETIDHLKTGSLVLFNEIFQSTAYEEGAKGLAPLLRWLSQNGVNWILVSHIHALRQYLTADDADFYRTSEGFVVEKE